MSRRSVVLPCVLVLAFPACSPDRIPALGLAEPGATCEVVTTHVVGHGEASARKSAAVALTRDSSDLKGEFVRAGFRGVREVRRNVACNPYALTGPGSDLSHCTAAARVCGR